MTTNIEDVCTFLRDHATQDDIDRVYAVAKIRTRTLQDARAASVRRGDTVSLINISPKALIGLTGEVQSISGKRAAVMLDEASTTNLRWSRTKHAARVSSDAETHLLTGVPLSCCKPL